MKGIFTKYRILGWIILFLLVLWMFLLAFIVSDEKLFVNFLRVPLYGWVIFLCYLPNFIFVFQRFDSDISGFGSLCVYPSWVSLSFLDVQTNGFHHPSWDILNHISSCFFPCSFLSYLSWYSHYTYVDILSGIPHVGESSFFLMLLKYIILMDPLLIRSVLQLKYTAQLLL